MSTSIQRAGHSNWLIATIAAAAVGALVLVMVVGGRQLSDERKAARTAQTAQQELARAVSCIEAWAVAQSTSNATVRTVSTTYAQALAREAHVINALLKASRRKETPTQVKNLTNHLFMAVTDYDRTYTAYLATLQAHPVLVPNLACDATVKPRPVPTQTVTTTTTSTRPAPPPQTVTRSSVRTVTTPGPARTVTRCRLPNGRPCR